MTSVELKRNSDQWPPEFWGIVYDCLIHFSVKIYAEFELVAIQKFASYRSIQ
jgi:hypothetical protein